MVRISDCSSKPVRILSYTLIVTGAIVLTMFIIPLFSGTLNTGSYFGFVIGGVTVLLGIFTPKLFSNAKKAVRYIFRAVLIIYGVLAVYAITLSAFMIANMNDAPEKDGSRTVIVLGCQIRGDRITRSLKRRLDSAYDYACINTECKIIVSGGQGRGENKTEALAMYEYLCERGIDSDRIIMEDKSTDTNENMKYSVQYISDFSSPVGIATNNFHIFRSKLLAKGQGLTHVSGIASGSDDVLFVNYMVREAIGIVKDFVCGNY